MFNLRMQVVAQKPLKNTSNRQGIVRIEADMFLLTGKTVSSLETNVILAISIWGSCGNTEILGINFLHPLIFFFSHFCSPPLLPPLLYCTPTAGPQPTWVPLPQHTPLRFNHWKSKHFKVWSHYTAREQLLHTLFDHVCRFHNSFHLWTFQY